MDSFTLNKIAGAVLGTCLIGMGIGIVADGIYEPEKPKKPGYALPEPKPGEEAGGKKGGESELPALLAKADPKKGEADAKVCGACHNFEEGAGAKVGPDLYGVVDREKGSVQGFDYSAGMKKKGGKWTYQDLFEFIKKPSAYVQGTKMGFGGEESPEKRADIIVYLRTLSKKPAELPKVAAGGEKKSGGGEKGGGEDQLIKLIAAADPKKGESDAQICGACHNFKKGEGAKVGPDLYGVVDREKGTEKGFDYSAGMKKKGGKWTYADLNQFLTKPSAYVQGTKMGFGGEANEKKRASIIAYLRSNADKPEPLPKPDEGGKKEAGGQPEGGKAAGGGGDEFAKLVAAADPKKGESATAICGACHNFKKGEGAKVGPDLYGVVDREKGSEPGFDYSPGMKKKGGKWTYDDLNQFLTKPSAYVQGTKMGFGGEANEKKRAAIVAYLRSNADKPAPLPGAEGDKKSEAAPAKPDEKKADDKAAPEKKTEAAPAKPGEKAEAAKGGDKKPDDKAAAPEKKSEAAPAKADDKKAEDGTADDKKPDDTTAAPEKKSEVAPAGSGDNKADSSAPEPYSAPTPDDAKAKSASAPSDDNKGASTGPEPYSAPTPDDAKAKSASAPSDDNKGASAGPEPYSAPTPDEAKGEPAAAPSDEVKPSSEPVTKADASGTASSGQNSGGGVEPFKAPTPDEAKAPASAPSDEAKSSSEPVTKADASGAASSGQSSGGGPEPFEAPTPDEAKEAK